MQNSRAPSLHGRYPASSLLRARPPPSRRWPTSRVRRLYGQPDSADFAAGRGGLLQLRDASWSPCCRSQPRRTGPPRQPDCGGPCCLRGVIDRSASGALDLSGPSRVHSHYGPVTRSPSMSMASSMGFRGSVSLPPAIQATRRLALAPAGLAPAEHIRFSLDARSPDPPAAAARAGLSGRGP